MIPARLSLKNFMCYRQSTVLSFENFHMACISGENGHGKSALLDAMTWALWGKSRAPSQDELVYLGEKDMTVEFDFDIPPHRYRIIRKRSRATLKSPGQTSLDLFISNTGQYQALSSGVAETERKIQELLKLDYRTFINSAYLRQGKADEFTRSEPAKRKEVLANILNLSLYEQLSEKAKEHRRLTEQEHIRLEANVESNRRVLEKKQEYIERKGSLEISLKSVSSEVETTREELEAEKKKKQGLELKETQAQQIGENLTRLRRDEGSFVSKINRHRQRLNEFTQLLNRKNEIEQSYKKYLSFKEEEKSLAEKFTRITKLREERMPLERLIDREESQLKNAQSNALSKLRELEEKISRKADLLIKGQALQNQAELISKNSEDLEKKKKIQSDYRETIAAYQAELKRLSSVLQDLKEKKSLIKQGKDTCPLCGSAVGQDGLLRIDAHYHEEMQLTEKNLRDVNENLRVASNSLKNLSVEILGLDKKLEVEKRQFDRDESLRQKALNEIEEAELKQIQEKINLESLNSRLEAGDYAREQRSAIHGLDKEIEALGYKEERHQLLKKELFGLEVYYKEKFRLDEAEKDFEREKAEEEQDEQELKGKREQIVQEEIKLKELNQELITLPQIKEKIESLEQRLKIKDRERGELLQQLGGVEAKLEECLEIERENERLAQENSRLEHEIKIYAGLTEAFSKKGVQALIIEAALPEISHEANELLSRLTEGRMNLRLEMQPESPGGKISEALEIKIADELGTRDYEMFSGGEAFRIDFALRIALSRFLARRAGAPLSLLIIDEGFGSQDETGKERLIEALNHIQNDFDKILVITHLPEMKEYFPYRINVIKTDEGSTISLEEG